MYQNRYVKKSSLSEAEVHMATAVAFHSPAALYVAGSACQGLFVRALPPDPAFHAELKSVGVDVDRLLPRYPLKTWIDGMAVARRHFFPGHTEQQGNWLLGRLFLLGFLDTMVGRVAGSLLPVLGPARMLERTQRHFALARPDMRVTVQVVGETERRLLFEGGQTPAAADFAGGILEAGLERTRTRAEVTVEDRQATSYVLRVRW
jgi:uncharacterized protein (TIGR02265 family)